MNGPLQTSIIGGSGYAGGELLRLRGSNGSGKTSLLRILSGLRRADAGSVKWQGDDIQHRREDYYASMVYIGHLPCIKNDLTTLENIRVLLDTRSQSVAANDIEQALASVGLAGFEDVAGKALSSGQRRRVLLAFLLLAGPVTAQYSAGSRMAPRINDNLVNIVGRPWAL